MLECKELTEISTDYLEGQLSLTPRMEVYLHLGCCAQCRRYLSQLKTTMRLLRQLPVAPARVSDEPRARPREKRLASPAVQRRGAVTLRLIDS